MKRSTLLSFLVVIFFSCPLLSQAASIVFSPTEKTIPVDTSFSVTISLSSTDKAVNAFSGTLTFPSDLLTAQSVSTDGSVANFWTIQPTIGSGTVRFEGLVLNPGFTGTSGKLFSITFYGKSQGTAYISLTGASTLANDGLGTNIYSGGTPQATIVVGQGAAVATSPSPTSGTPLAPLVSSSSHPDPFGWYAHSIAELSWDIPASISSVAYLIDKNPTTTPTTSKGIVSSYTTSTLSDGEYYFHIRFRNANGWGAVAHYRIGVDTVAPLAVSIEPLTDILDGTLHVRLSSLDTTSGIRTYEISLDGKEPVLWTPTSPDEVYVSGVLSSGRHLIFVRALDKAGNASANGMYVSLEAVPPPIFTAYPETMENGDRVTLEGTAVLGSTVVIYFEKRNVAWYEKIIQGGQIRRETELVKVPVNEQGAFSFTHSTPWHNGNYHIWAKTILPNGAESLSSDFVEVNVLPGGFARGVGFLQKILLPLIPLILILFIIGGLLVLFLKAFRRYKSLIFKEAHKAEETARNAFGGLKGEVHTEVDSLPRTTPPTREAQFLKNFAGHLENAETDVENTIANVEKTIDSPGE